MNRAPILEKRKAGQRLGLLGYLFALREVQKKPRTAEALGEVLKMMPNHAALLMRRLRSVSLVHIASWEKRADGVAVALFKFGEGQDAEPPPSLRRVRASPSVNINASAITVKHLMRAVAGLASKAEIAEMTGLHYPNTCTIVAYMHEIGLVHIGGWTHPPRGMPIALYVSGGTRDAERPKPREGAREKRRQRKIDLEGRVEMLTMIRATAANADQILEAA